MEFELTLPIIIVLTVLIGLGHFVFICIYFYLFERKMEVRFNLNDVDYIIAKDKKLKKEDKECLK